jgi:hypothetical protein
MRKPRVEIPVMEPLENFETWLLIGTAANLGSLRESDDVSVWVRLRAAELTEDATTPGFMANWLRPRNHTAALKATCGVNSRTCLANGARASMWSATTRRLLGHREGERSEKGYGEHGSKSVRHYYGRVPKWLPGPNERNRKRHDCQRQKNNHSCAENSSYILARNKFAPTLIEKVEA